MLTLLTLLQNALLTQPAILVGARAISADLAVELPRLFACARAAQPGCRWVACLQRVWLLVALGSLVAFFVLVQIGYVRANVRKVRQGVPPTGQGRKVRAD